VSTDPGNQPVASPGRSASAIGGPPGSIPAARAGAVYVRSVVRSTPKLAASSFCDRSAYQWVKISSISIMSKVLLANAALLASLLGNEDGACGLARPDRHDTRVLPMGNDVIAGWGIT
jgi:hypothetical protein